jgi:hypothetical protein
MATIQQQKRGTSDRWSALDPVLAAGEIGYETDTIKFKIGDGSTPWSSLSYFSTTSGGGGSGTVTSVDLSVPTGLTVSGNPVTTSGTLAISLASGYSIPDTTSQGYWTNAYNWGDHAAAGYQPGDADLTAIAALSANGLLRKTAGSWGMDSATYLTSGSSLDANNLNGTIQGGVLGNSTLYVGTTAVVLNRSSSNQALTGITSITGGTGTTTITFTSADNTGTPTGAVLLTSGVATTSTAGTVKVDSGNNGTPGSGGANVGIGTINASSVTIGRTGITTTIAGTLSATIPGIDSTIQRWDADLDAVAALSGTGLAKRTGAGTWTTITDDSTNWNTAYTDRNKWDGGSTGLTPATGRTSLGATTVGSNIFTLTNPSATRFIKINADNSVTAEDASTYVASLGANTVGQNIFALANPSAITFLRMNANNTVSALSDVNFRTAIGAGTGNGTVTTLSVVSANGFTGIVANATTTPAITLTTSITGLLSGNGTAISAASVGYGDTTNPYGSKTANYVLAGPASGVSLPPSFRALVSADIPDLSGTYALSSRTVWGQALSGDVTGNLTSVGTITGTSGTTLAISQVSISATTGNAVSIAGGSNTQSTGTPTGGSISITGGAQTNATPIGTGGAVTISGGTGGTNGGGGDVNIRGGIGGGNGNGSVNIGTTSATAAVTIGNSGTTVNIQNPLLTSVSVVGGGGAEGGQINFARVTDGNQYWAIDSFGTSGTPSLRFIESATTQLTLATGGIATFAGAVKLRGGSNAADTAPLYFGSSTSLLSSTAPGAMEFNNKALYFTPDVTPGRALVATPFYKIIATDNSTLINVSPGVPTTYSVFGTNGIALDTGVAYEVEMVLLLSATAATNSSTLIITPGSPTGAAVPSASQLYYNYSASTTVMTNAAATSAVLRTGTTTFPALNTVTIATGTTQYVKAYMKGIVNIATGGNFTIRMAFTPTSPGTVTGTIYAGSYLKITPLGSEGVTDVGTWA